MPWCFCKNSNTLHKYDLKEIQKCISDIKEQQKELLKKHKQLECKINKIKLTRDCKETKLNLCETINDFSKCKKRNIDKRPKKIKKTMKNKEKNNSLNDIIFNNVDKFLKIENKFSEMLTKNRRGLTRRAKQTFYQKSIFPRPLKGPRSEIQSRQSRQSRWNEAAGDCYLMSMPTHPQVWIRNRWPSFYPHYIETRIQWRNLKHFLLFVLGFLVFIPGYLCLQICKCCFCACCIDC